MHLFIQGQSRIGKSTLLRNTLIPVAASVAGFVTQRLMENEKVIGYRALSIAGDLPLLETGYETNQSGIFLINFQLDISVLESVILLVEQATKSPSCKLILLDEIGGVELKSGVFFDALLRIMNGEKPCIGVWKSTSNLSHTISRLKLNNEYLNPHDSLEQIVRSKGELLTVTDANKESLHGYIKKYIQQMIK
ncbi:MAG: nucleoside-triphosphatase [Dehalococcoidia bacterium]|nr:nucleoside-triphosphatase [Dehalococcoidia bacterium]